MRRTRSALAAMLAAATLVPSSGCFGRFGLTRELYDKNRSVDGKAARSGVFLALILIPVYPAALLADMLIFNPIELATGENPMDDRDEGPTEP